MLACCVIIATTLPAMSCRSAGSTTQPAAAAPAAAAGPAPSTATSPVPSTAASPVPYTATRPVPAAVAPAGVSTEDDAPDPIVTPANRQQSPRAPVVDVSTTGTLTWAYLDRAAGLRYQSDNAADTSYTESMIKVWLAADDLRRAAENGWDPDYELLAPMIIDSDDNAAETVWLNNGADESVARMISLCQLVDTQVYPGWWSMTGMSARDAVTLGQCIADGTAAGPGTDWLLAQMRDVRGEGRFGIIDALTASDGSTVAIKNGWTLHYDDGTWRVNCLAIHPDWIIAVMTTYQGTDDDLAYGANLCAQVTSQLLVRSAR